MLKKSHLYTLKKHKLEKANLYILFFLACLILSVTNIIAQPKYEFRGVWVATVDNIDWPSDKFLSSESQKAEFISLLDMHQRNRMNAVIVQIRPATDAFYPSQYEPWSEWLTGRQGKPPIPYYDPLEFMINETHKRGMEFHAWMNPYRAEFSVGRSPMAQTHITKLHPDWFVQYGTLRLFDPGNKEVQQFVTNIVKDVVSRYDVDAIHFDDYFYPYPIAGKEFPDDVSFLKYGNGLAKADWRRSNVDSIIRKLGETIKQENKYCKFGISPFGVWRSTDKDPSGSNTRGSLSNYDDLYADILLWLKNKWIDYVAPQLYWEFGHRIAPFGTLVDWWANHTYGRHLYIGHGIYRAIEERSGGWKSTNELPNQLKKVRSYPQVQGSIYYSSKWFYRNPNGWNDSLQNNYYKYPAIVPPMPWIDNEKPDRPFLNIDSTLLFSIKDSLTIYFRLVKPSTLNRLVIYSSEEAPGLQSKAQNIFAIINSSRKNFVYNLRNIPSGQTKVVIGVSALSKNNVESDLSRYVILERTETGWRPVFDVANN